jgi:hypothetical protein
MKPQIDLPVCGDRDNYKAPVNELLLEMGAIYRYIPGLQIEGVLAYFTHLKCKNTLEMM